MGQGWATGLAGLATDLGVDVTGGRPAVVDVRERISLRKEAVRVSLEKKGIASAGPSVARRLTPRMTWRGPSGFTRW